MRGVDQSNPNRPQTLHNPSATNELAALPKPCREFIILDVNPSLRIALKDLLSKNGFHADAYHSVEEMRAKGPPQVPTCLILDNQLGEGWTGFQVQETIRRMNWKTSTIFLTAHWDPTCSVRAIKAGAEGFPIKPFDPEELLSTVAIALEKAEAMAFSSLQSAQARALAAQLTVRELEIVQLVMKGLIHKEIAD